MGITIHYRGKMEDLGAIESLEDRVIDLVLACGGLVRVWRSVADDNPQRIVRGLIVNLEPEQESFSLLFSPEGDLIPLTEIEEAEKHPLAEQPWCFVKTQFGSVVGHAALVETLAQIKGEFIPQLEVHDESEYWTHRDPVRLATLMNQNAKMIAAVKTGLQQHPLSAEASEDPEIVAERVARIAKVVQHAFRKPEQQTANRSDEYAADWQEFESQWDELYRTGAARTLRMQRHIEDRLLAGDSAQEAIESALARIRENPAEDQPTEATASTEPESLSPLTSDDAWLEESWNDDLDIEESTKNPAKERDPLLEQATQLFLAVANLAESQCSPAIDSMLASAGDLCGGLSQVLPLPPTFEMNDEDRGITVVQLKRALRGAAFLRAALFNQHTDTQHKELSSRLLDEIEYVQGEIIDHLRNVRRRNS